MISVDLVYKTVLTLVNSEIRGNVTPSEFKLLANDVVNEIYEEYLPEVVKLTNRHNKGLMNGGLEHLPDRLREKIYYFLKESALTYSNSLFTIPSDCRYIDTVYYLTNEIEPCKSMKEFNIVSACVDTSPTFKYPIYIKIGNSLKVAPATINTNVTAAYLRNPVIANWTYVVINGTEIFNPSAGDFADIDLHSSELTSVIHRILLRFGINLKEQDIQIAVQNKDQQDFQQKNSN